MDKKITIRLVILAAIVAIVAIDIFTDYLNLGFGNVDLGAVEWDRYFGGITTLVILGTCFLISVAIMAVTIYHRA